MPTLPLFDSSATPAGASHHVRAPGGYEIWRFAAHDPNTQTWMSVSFHQDFPSHQYLRRYLRFRRWPTRFAPPLPGEYPTVSIWIRSPQRTCASKLRFDPASYLAPRDGGIQIGPNRFSAAIDGAVQLRTSAIDLIFRPRSSRKPVELFSASAQSTKGETHQWVIAAGLCDVSGTIDVGEISVPFTGRGFHDQQYGTAPMFRDIFRGRLLLKEKAMVFQQSDLLHVVTDGTDGLAIEPATPAGAPWNHTAWGLSYPRSMRLKEDLSLAHPRVVDSKPLGAQILYEANWHGEQGVALCEIASPHRLAWPILGGLIELARV